jgi:hypothetical protein
MNNFKKGTAALILTSVLASAGGAHAQDGEGPDEFGDEHQLVLATERIFGYVHSSQTQTVAGMDQTVDVDSFSIFSSPLSIATIYSAPRLALDYFVAERFSIGLAASYFRITQDAPDSPNAFEPKYTGFLFAPRVGYVVPVSPVVAFWPRLGFTVMNLELSTTSGTFGTSSSSSTLYALTIEAPLVLTIAPHVFLALAPTLDLGLGGSDEDTTAGVGSTSSIDTKATSFGLQFALGGYF